MLFLHTIAVELPKTHTESHESHDTPTNIFCAMLVTIGHQFGSSIRFNLAKLTFDTDKFILSVKIPQIAIL